MSLAVCYPNFLPTLAAPQVPAILATYLTGVMPLPALCVLQCMPSRLPAGVQ